MRRNASERLGRCYGIAAVLVLSSACDRAIEADWVLDHVDVLDVITGELRLDQSVAVHGGVIVGVGDSARFTSTVRVRGGGIVVPGLVDMHVHIRQPGVLPLHVLRGITTVRDMNGHFGDPATWTQDVASGSLVAPRITRAAPTIRLDQDSAYPAAVRTAADARQFVDELAGEWALIKVAAVPESAWQALLSAAAARGIPIAGHVPWFAPPEATIDASRRALVSAVTGMQTVEHMGGLEHAWFRGTRDLASLDAFAQAVRGTGVAAVTPILAQDFTFASMIGTGAAAIGPAQREAIRRYTGDDGLAAILRQAEAMRGGSAWDPSFQVDMAAALHRAGVPLVIGTDAHGPAALAGLAWHEEARILSRVMPAIDVLRAGTVRAAAVLGLGDRIGRVEQGFDADFLLLGSDPRDSVAALADIRGVALRGRWLDRSALVAIERVVSANPPFCATRACR